MSHRTTRVVLLLIAGFLLTSMTQVQAQTTNFNYQGRLSDGGNVANGSYDFQFLLFDALTNGTQIGSTQALNAVAVSNGVFKVTLDFGANSFSGGNRFLEIRVRLSGGTGFTILDPRQQITSTPYAIRSLNASSADTVVVNGVPPGSGNYIQNSTTPQASSNFNVSGDGTAGGTLSANFVNANTQFNLGGNRILSADAFFNNLYIGPGTKLAFSGAGTSNTFVGARAGQSNAGDSNSFFGSLAGSNSVGGSQNSFFGAGAGRADQGGTNNTVIGFTADLGSPSMSNATAIGAQALVQQNNAMVLGSIAGINGATSSVKVGVGTTQPQSSLHVRGTGWFTGDDTPLPGLASRGVGIGLSGTVGYVFAFNYGTNQAATLALNGPGGSVGIGTTSPARTLEVAGQVRVANCVENAGGTVIAGSCPSDKRYKRDITPFHNLLDRVVKLQPVNYYWRSAEFPERHFGTRQSYGLIAQDVERVLPELVGEDTEGFKTVDYSKLPLMMLQAIKEQQTQIEQQRANNEEQRRRIIQQQAEIKKQQEELSALKQMVCRRHRRASMCR